MGDAGSPALGAGVRFEPDSGEISGPEGTARLAPQPAALLWLLLAHRGEVVDRDRIKDELWPGGNVEFDQGIAFAVREVRKALTAVGADPAQVETLPRRGLRLNARPETSPRAGGDGRGNRDVRRRPAALLAAVLVFVALAGGAVALASGSDDRPVVAVFPYEVAADGAVPRTGSAVPDAERAPPGVRGAAADGDAAGVGELVALAITARTATELRGLLGVIGPTATGVLSGPGDTDAARDDLGACLVVSGVLRYAGPDTVHVFSQIVRTADRVHTWARWDTASVGGSAERVADQVVRALEEARSGC